MIDVLDMCVAIIEIFSFLGVFLVAMIIIAMFVYEKDLSRKERGLVLLFILTLSLIWSLALSGFNSAYRGV